MCTYAIISINVLLCVCSARTFWIMITRTVLLVLASEIWYKGTNASSIRSPVVDEERMRRGNWLELMLCVPSSAFRLMVCWQEGQSAHRKTLFH